MATDTDKDRRFNDGDEPEDDGPPPWSITIDKVANGFICAGSDGRIDVFEEPHSATLDPDPDTVARMLWRIVEHFGAIGSKHDARRIYIDVQPGDDYPDQTKH